MRPGRISRTTAAATVAVAIAFGAAAQSENPAHAPSAGDFGGVGLMQTRTARFQPDGTLDVSTVFVDPYRRYIVNFQPLPWVEATFRYTDIRNRLFSQNFDFSGDQSFKDRGADLKFKLLEESEYLPQIALGLQDGLGTGLFQSEYLVLSKRYYDLDFHAGVAWGLLGSRGGIKNPLTLLHTSFKDRSRDFGQGGSFNLGSYFAGEEIGVFAGVEWATPVDGLSLKLEYDGNDYRNDPLGNRFEVDLPVNVGMVYRPLPFIELAAGLERGNTAMFRASLRANIKDANFPKNDPAPPKVTVRPRPSPEELPRGRPAPGSGLRDEARLALLGPGALPRPSLPDDPPLAAAPPPRPAPALPTRPVVVPGGGEPAVVAALFDKLEAQGFDVEEVSLNQGEAHVSVRRRPGATNAAPLQAVAALLAEALPSAVDKVTLSEPGASVSAERAEIERARIVDFLFEELAAQGYDLEAIELTHDAVEARVSAMAGRDGQDATRAAGVLLRALPVPVRQVRLVRLEAGIERSRIVVGRAEAERAGRIDALFDGLQAFGLEVEQVELARGQATITVAAAAGTGEADLRRAARLVADQSPDPVDAVDVVALRAGAETLRVTWRRQDTGAPRIAVAGAEAPARATQVAELSQDEKRAIAEAVFADLERQGFDAEAIHIGQIKATVYVTPNRYRQLARNIGRASRVVANHVPASVELIEVVTLAAGMEIARVTVVRSDLENVELQRGSAEEIFAHARIDDPQVTFGPFGDAPDDLITAASKYPNFSWKVRPALRESIGGPDGFFLYQVYLALSARAELYRGLSVTGTLSKNIYNNFDEITLASDSVLPRVRSNIKEYLQQGEDGNIGKLQADYLFSPAPDWYARVSAGLLEEMFGGVGGEVLYRPYGSRLAISVDVNHVRQRGFRQRFDFQDYEITTGHLNLYYDIPYMGLNGEMHIGRFLAGDLGSQFVLSRTFDSGVTIGAWATLTNVSAEDFGEGSFDKGFFVSVPFELFLPQSTTSRGSFAFRPLTRDGGQMLGIGPRLYYVTQRGNKNAIFDTWDQFLD
ncbi:MAG: YjbH domain-containing protein [Alphaproteobacteria bacterium]